MANYNITVDSTFTPYDFSSKLNPILNVYDEKYTTAYDQYKKEKQEAAALLYIIESIGELEISDTYNEYMENLKDFGESFLNGYTQQTQQDSLDLRELYFKDINPILELYDKKQELIKELMDFLRLNPTAIYDRDFRTTSISEMLKDPQMTYNTIKGDDIVKDTYNFMTAVSKAVYSNNFEGLDDLSKQFIKQWEREGYSPDTIMKFLTNPNSAPPHVRKGIEEIKSKYLGMGNFDNYTDLIDKYMLEGAMLGSGTYSYKWFENPNYDLNPEMTAQLAKWAYEEKEANHRKALADADMAELKLKEEKEDNNTNNSNKNNNKSTNKPVEIKSIGSEEDKKYVITDPNTGQTIIEADYKTAIAKAAALGAIVDPQYKLHPDYGEVKLAIIQPRKTKDGSNKDKHHTTYSTLSGWTPGNKDHSLLTNDSPRRNEYYNPFNEADFNVLSGMKNVTEVTDEQKITNIVTDLLKENKFIDKQGDKNNGTTKALIQDLVSTDTEKDAYEYLRDLYIAEIIKTDESINKKYNAAYDDAINEGNTHDSAIDIAEDAIEGDIYQILKKEYPLYAKKDYNDDELVIHRVIQAIKNGKLSILSIPQYKNGKYKSKNDYVIVKAK